MNPNTHIAIDTLLAFAAVLMAFLGAVTFVAATRGSNRSSRWGSQSVGLDARNLSLARATRAERASGRPESGPR